MKNPVGVFKLDWLEVLQLSLQSNALHDVGKTYICTKKLKNCHPFQLKQRVPADSGKLFHGHTWLTLMPFSLKLQKPFGWVLRWAFFF